MTDYSHRSLCLRTSSDPSLPPTVSTCGIQTHTLVCWAKSHMGSEHNDQVCFLGSTEIWPIGCELIKLHVYQCSCLI